MTYPDRRAVTEDDAACFGAVERTVVLVDRDPGVLVVPRNERAILEQDLVHGADRSQRAVTFGEVEEAVPEPHLPHHALIHEREVAL